jgi:hypothetical protein
MSIDWSSVAAVAQVTDCTPENIDGAVLNSSKPLVLKNFGRNLPLVKAGKESGEQALDYLRQHYAAMPITTCYGAPETKGRVYYNSDMSDFNFHMKRQSLGAFVEEFIRHKDSLAPPTLYIPSTDLAPSLAQENSLGLEYLNPVKSIWVGTMISPVILPAVLLGDVALRCSLPIKLKIYTPALCISLRVVKRLVWWIFLPQT